MGRFSWQDERTDLKGVWRFSRLTIGITSVLLAVQFGLVLFGSLVTSIRESAYDIELLWGIATLLPLTVFFWMVGSRLLSGRPAKTGGGLLSPMEYRLFGVFWIGLAAICSLAYLAIFSLASGPLEETFFFMLMTFLGFVFWLFLLFLLDRPRKAD